MELNQTISTEARNLTDALKGNSKVQGDWGEMLLETILDSSALIKGIHYQTQYNIKDEEGRNLRPDVVLHLPEKKDIVIDSEKKDIVTCLDGECITTDHVHIRLADQKLNFFGPDGCSCNATARETAPTGE